jgi:hypothetical protein
MMLPPVVPVVVPGVPLQLPPGPHQLVQLLPPGHHLDIGNSTAMPQPFGVGGGFGGGGPHDLDQHPLLPHQQHQQHNHHAVAGPGAIATSSTSSPSSSSASSAVPSVGDWVFSAETEDVEAVAQCLGIRTAGLEIHRLHCRRGEFAVVVPLVVWSSGVGLWR